MALSELCRIGIGIVVLMVSLFVIKSLAEALIRRMRLRRFRQSGERLQRMIEGSVTDLILLKSALIDFDTAQTFAIETNSFQRVGAIIDQYDSYARKASDIIESQKQGERK